MAVVNGTEGNNTLYGTGGDDVISGGGGDDVIKAGSGKDRLDGGAGKDRLYGGAGDDIYYVDDLGDVVVEPNGYGNDLVYASVSFAVLSQYIEQVILTGTAAINATGNGLANIL